MGKTRGYLTTIGFINPAGQVTLRKGYLLPNLNQTQATRAQASEIPVTAVQLDGQGSVISTLDLPAADAHADPAGGEFFFFAGQVPLDEACAKVQLSKKGTSTPLATVTIPAHPPSVQLTWVPGAQVSGKQTVAWTASHPDGLPLEFLVFYSSDIGTTLRPLSPSLTQTSLDVDFDRLPGGQSSCLIQVLATDGGNTVAATSPLFSAPIKPVQALLLAPKDQATVPGPRVTLKGQGYLLEEDQPELDALSWQSSIDGALGTGRIVQPKLSKGVHTISLTAGQGNRAGSASITITVT